MRVLELQIENVKKIKAISIDASDKDVVVITGKNGQGKSTILDSIAYAMGGESLCPEKPIREGQSKGLIAINLGKYKVTRHWWYDPDNKIKSRLEVKTDQDVKLKAGQTVLNSLIKDKIIDVYEYSKLDNKKQVEIIKEITKIDFTSLDTERSKIYIERTLLNRESKSLKSRIDAITVPEGVIRAESLPQLYKQKQEFIQFNMDIDNKQNKSNLLKAEIIEKEKELDSVAIEILRLEKKAKELDRKLKTIKTELESDNSHTLKKRSFEEIDKNIKIVTENQEIIRLSNQKVELQKILESKEKGINEINERIEDIDDEKASILKRCRMPIEGLSFDSNSIFYNGIPYKQLSSAEEISVSAAICMKYNPNFKVLYTRHASLLDKEHIDLLSKITKEEGFQLWLEKVSEDPEGNSIHIVDGEIDNE